MQTGIDKLWSEWIGTVTWQYLAGQTGHKTELRQRDERRDLHGVVVYDWLCATSDEAEATIATNAVNPSVDPLSAEFLYPTKVHFNLKIIDLHIHLKISNIW